MLWSQAFKKPLKQTTTTNNKTPQQKTVQKERSCIWKLSGNEKHKSSINADHRSNSPRLPSLGSWKGKTSTRGSTLWYLPPDYLCDTMVCDSGTWSQVTFSTVILNSQCPFASNTWEQSGPKEIIWDLPTWCIHSHAGFFYTFQTDQTVGPEDRLECHLRLLMKKTFRVFFLPMSVDKLHGVFLL